MSPVLYVAAIGLAGFAARRPPLGIPILVGIAAMTYFNASIHDWWGSASYGGRRFDGVVPLLVPGLAVAFEAVRSLLARRPLVVAVTASILLIVWNLTFMRSAGGDSASSREAVSFRDIGAAQARVLHGWIGHPFSYPASLIFALRNGLPPGSYDVLNAARFLGDPARPYGRIDIGVSDEVFIAGGWETPEREADITFRRIRHAAVVLVPLDSGAALDVQVRARADADPSQGRPQMTIDVNGQRFGSAEVTAEWSLLTMPTPRMSGMPGSTA
jgi:hypothetical protein